MSNRDPQTQQLLVISIEYKGSHQLFHIENKDKLILHLLWIRNPTRPSSKGCEVAVCNQNRFSCVLQHYYQHLIDWAISSSLNYNFSLQLLLFQVQENQMRIKGTSDKEDFCFSFINTKLSLDENTRKYKPEFRKLPSHQRLGLAEINIHQILEIYRCMQIGNRA